MTTLAAAAANPPIKHAHALHWLMSFGSLGLFAVSAVDSSVIPLPLPGSTDLLLLLMVARGGNPWLMAAATIAGSILGGYFTWQAGAKGGEAGLKSYAAKRYFRRVTQWVKRNGGLAVAFAALVPPPLPLLPFLLAAGALGVSRRKFFIAYSAARVLRYSLVAWLGVVYGRQLVRLWTRYLAGWTTPIIWTFVALLVLGIGFGVWKYRKSRGHQASPAKTRLAPASR